MSVDDTLSRRIRDEGSRRGSFTGRGNHTKAAEAAAKIEKLKALRAYHRAKEALTAAGIHDPDAELTRVLS